MVDHSGVQGSVVQRGLYIDEVGRTRDAGTGAIHMPGFRRLPPAADITYVERLERQNAALEVENQELRTANKGLQCVKNAGAERIAALEKEKRMMLEEIDRLRVQVAVTFEQSRNHEIASMFLDHDNAEMRSHIQHISGQNAALASGLIGTPIDPTAGKLYSRGSISDMNSPAFDQYTQSIQGSVSVPALPSNPIERSKYSAADRVKCLLAKVGVAPGMVLSTDQCCEMQGALDGVNPDNEAYPALQDMCAKTCGTDGLPYETAVNHFKSLSSASLAKAEKALRLTTVYFAH